MIRVNGDVQSHQFNEFLVITETEQSRQVGRVILVLVDGGEFTITVNVPEDSTGNVGQLGDQIHGVIKGGLPVISLVNTVRVSFSEGGVVVELFSRSKVK